MRAEADRGPYVVCNGARVACAPDMWQESGSARMAFLRRPIGDSHTGRLGGARRTQGTKL